MATSPSQRIRRMAQKASRRKAIVAEKHKAGSTMSGREALQIIGAAQAPVRTCVMAERLFADGIGWVVLARTLPSGQVGASFFLVDVWCLGVKDAFFLVMPQLAFEERMHESSRDQPVVVIDPSVARKLLHDAAAYAGSFGLGCQTISMTMRNTFRFPISESVTSASRSSSNSCASSYRTTSMKFSEYSAEKVPTLDSRTCWFEGGHSINGMVLN
jgi:hypothetical protein